MNAQTETFNRWNIQPGDRVGVILDNNQSTINTVLRGQMVEWKTDPFTNQPIMVIGRARMHFDATTHGLGKFKDYDTLPTLIRLADGETIPETDSEALIFLANEIKAHGWFDMNKSAQNQ
ncbi:hypothetical protein [Microcystis phage Mel-JY01]